MTSLSDSGTSTGLHDFYLRADRIMLVVLNVTFLYALALAPWHGTWPSALLVGGGTLAMMAGLSQIIAGTRLYRCLVAIALMVMSALHIHQSHGTVEMHFSIFVLLAFLIYYRDWLPIVIGTVVIAVHHLLFFQLQLSGYPVWVSEHGSWGMIWIHAAYVVAEAVVLVYLALLSQREAREGEAMAEATRKVSEDGEHINLAYRVPMETPVAESFNGLLAQIDTLVRDVDQRVGALREMGDALKTKAQQVSNGAEQNAAESEYITQAMQEMSSATAEVARNAEQAASAGRNADSHAARGDQAMQDVRREIEALNHDITATGESVMGAARLAGDIHQVLDVIKGVAEQTNLLALNAAIEAARAGEHGRGFAVVADEVRTLSQRTAEATVEIQQFVQNLEQASDSARSAMTRSEEAVQRSLEAVGSGVETLSGMAGEINEISRLNDMTAAASQEQSTVGDDVGRHLQEVGKVASSNAAQAVDLTALASELQSLSADLDRQVKRFSAAPGA